MTATTASEFRELFVRDDEPDAPPLVVRNLRVQFGGLSALRDVDFSLQGHETMAIVGQNGAGKSTLLNAISGLVPAVPGSQIELRGTPLQGKPAWRRSLAGLGRAFQDPPLVDNMSLRDNLLVGSDAFSRDHRAAGVRADFLLDLIGLLDSAVDDAGGLPYGGRKLLDITRALMSRPRVLLLDEPTSGLDETEQGVVTGILQMIHEADCITILMVEHHMNLVRGVADRVLVLDAGAVLLIAPPDEALAGAPAKNGAVK